jgi:cation diffusion facilitator CzcD-associated flavoprotein CzcO
MIVLVGQVHERRQDVFDAVVVAVGNYHEPNLVRQPFVQGFEAARARVIGQLIALTTASASAPRAIFIFASQSEALGSRVQPDVAGMDSFPGLQVHCHNYRHNERFREKVVVIMGASFSGLHAMPCHAGTICNTLAL